MPFSSETEEKIYHAAREIFIQKGRDGARMEDIARQASINKALLHYYFRSKERLYQQVFQQEITRVVTDLFQSIPLEMEMPDFLSTFINNYIDRLNQNPFVIRFMLWELRHGAKNITAVIPQIFASGQFTSPDKIVEKFNLAVKSKEIRPVDGQHLFMNLIAMCIYSYIAEPIIHVIFPGTDVREKSFIEKKKKEIFNVIWNGIKP